MNAKTLRPTLDASGNVANPQPSGQTPQLPVLIAGPVSSEEELASIQQIALITQWLRMFSWVAQGGTLGEALEPPQSPVPPLPGLPGPP